MSRQPLKPEHLMARAIRAFSGLKQDEMGEESGIPSSLIDQVEQGKVMPDGDHLKRIAACAGITEADAEELLRVYQTQRDSWHRSSQGVDTTLDNLVRRLRLHCANAFRRLLKLRPPERPPAAEEDRRQAEEQIASLKRLSRRSRLAAVRLIEELQTWSLVERCSEESVRQVSRSLKRAASWARLALVIARFVPGPKGWTDRVRAYALAHWANILRVRGKLKAAEARLEAAKRLWHAGSDPGGLLDPGRLLDLEASLRRDQRRFAEALALFDQAVPVSRFPERFEA
jgi:transcriptional regulator with XRE-family HTH domain